MPRLAVTKFVVGIAAVSVALVVGPADATPTSGGHATRTAAFPANARFDYQIGGSYRPAAGVGIVDRDRSSASARGKFNVCYVNAFQTQPGEAHFWRTKHPNLILRANGRPVTDPDWPGEYLLDTSTRAKRTALLRIVGSWIDGCANRGYQAIEPDNLDSWTRSHHRLSKAGNLAFVTLLAARAHKRGLLIAQKNTSELGTAGKKHAHLDFAIAEECQVYAECGRYTRVYGSRVVEVEYTDNGRRYFTAACAARGKKTSIILRDRDVTPAGDRAYRYAAC